MALTIQYQQLVQPFILTPSYFAVHCPIDL